MFRTRLALLVVCSLAASLAHADITNITQGTTHPTIQDAVDNANDHDEIVVDPGVYEEDRISLGGKPLTLRSQDPLDAAIVTQTILKGNPQTIIYAWSGEGPDTIISGLVFTEVHEAPAVYVADSSPTISHCTFQGNQAWENSAALIVHNSSALIADCAFIGNATPTDNGTVRITFGAPTFRNCTFDGNDADGGGGAIFMTDTSATFEACEFRQNTANVGAAVYADLGCQSTLTNCRFLGNEAVHYGGAVVVDRDSTMTLDDCRFIGNSTGDTGAAILVSRGSHVTVNNCRLERNSAAVAGGGIHLDDDSVDTCSLQNTIVAANLPDQIVGTYDDLGGNAVGDYAAPPAAPANSCPEDIDGDGVVGQSDLGMLLAAYGDNCP